nr:MAG TPA: hypothetical protein [Caudoviricetes sp.]
MCDNIVNFVCAKDKFLSVDVQNIIEKIEKNGVKIHLGIGDDLAFVRLDGSLSAFFLSENDLYWYLVGVWNAQILGINK